jgi:hypothetical protein
LHHKIWLVLTALEFLYSFIEVTSAVAKVTTASKLAVEQVQAVVGKLAIAIDEMVDQVSSHVATRLV